VPVFTADRIVVEIGPMKIFTLNYMWYTYFISLKSLNSGKSIIARCVRRVLERQRLMTHLGTLMSSKSRTYVIV